MSKRKLSAANFRQLQGAGRVGIRYPPGGNRAEVRIGVKPSRARARRAGRDGDIGERTLWPEGGAKAAHRGRKPA